MMTQFCGLSERAHLFLKKHAVHDHVEVMRNGDVEEEYDEPCRREGHVIYGMFGEPLQLCMYFLQDGTYAREVVQKEIQASGLVIFTCLIDDSGNKIGEWTDEEIKEAT